MHLLIFELIDGSLEIKNILKLIVNEMRGVFDLLGGTWLVSALTTVLGACSPSSTSWTYSDSESGFADVQNACDPQVQTGHVRFCSRIRAHADSEPVRPETQTRLSWTHTQSSQYKSLMYKVCMHLHPYYNHIMQNIL